jgi:hypothetical protein
VVKGGSRPAFAFAFVLAVSCAGATTTSGGAGGNASPGGATIAPATASGGSGGGSGAPSFKAILASSKLSEYKVTYRLTAIGQSEASSGEQSWYFKGGNARFDFSSAFAGQRTTVSLYALMDGVFMCFGGGAETQCIGMTSLDIALQQNPAALYQESLIQHPDQFSGVLVETRQIAGQRAHCYDVKSLAGASAALTDGRFCYSTQGIPLLSRFTGQTGTWAMEATSLSTTVPDSAFKLPATPTMPGRP